MNRARWLLPTGVVLALGVQAALLAHRPAAGACPPGLVCLDPARTLCFVFDMTPAKWQLVAKDERLYLSTLYKQRKADYKFQREGVDCYERDQYFVLGEKVASLPVEWWKPGRRP